MHNYLIDKSIKGHELKLRKDRFLKFALDIVFCSYFDIRS